MAPSSSRNGARVLWVTIHTAEGIRKAADLKAFFDRATDRSAHAVADDQALIENCVPYDRAAWTLRNGNTRSDNLELCGFAAWTRDEWLTNHKGMLNFAADWARSRCLARGIPIVKLSPADVAAGKSGVIGHVDYTLGTHDGTHTDPGPGFPWDYVIARAGQDQQQESDMPLSNADLEKIVTAIKYKVLAADDFRFDGRNVIDMLLAIQDVEAAQSTALATLTDDETNIIAAIRAIQTGAVDVTALVAALAPALAPLIKAGATQDQVEAAMRNVFASVGKSA